MHGYADLTSTTLWIQTDAPGMVTVAWRPEGETAERHVELMAARDRDNVVVARLTGMKPGMTASYRVDAGTDRRDGTIRAQPFWTSAADAPPLTIAIGSCFYLADPDPRWPGQDYGGGFGIFDVIAAQKPDLMLWLGDNLYLQQPDLLDPASMAMRYRRQRAFAPLQSLLTATSHIAIWDDHDYGPNDSDASYVMKGETLKLFERYWPNPSFGLPDVAGTFGEVRYGDVLFFLLDDRWYRSPDRWPDGPDKTMFGARQMEWLKQALVSAPRAAIKIVAAGGQFWTRTSRFEGWHAVRHRAPRLRRVAARGEDRGCDLSFRRSPFRRAPEDRPARRLSALRIHVEPAHFARPGEDRRRRAQQSGRRSRNACAETAIRIDPRLGTRQRSQDRARSS